jgi:hypothetical protein
MQLLKVLLFVGAVASAAVPSAPDGSDLLWCNSQRYDPLMVLFLELSITITAHLTSLTVQLH